MSSPFKKFSFYTFGCKVNFADSSSISRSLLDLGYTIVPIEDNPDICIINTCSVTQTADNKAKKLIHRINKDAPNTKIIVTGCYAQLKPDEIQSIKGVSLVVGTEDKFDVNKYINKNESNQKKELSHIENVSNFDISYSLTERTRAFLKIQDGCDYNCTYCTIPNARGKSRSENVDNTINKINNMLKNDVKEIVFSGINLGDFGINNNENLFMLLKEVENINSLLRYRISSIEPNLINNDIVQLLSNSVKAARHLHIPLQSGSNRILKLMKRRYTVKYYSNLINDIKKNIPNICIGVDVIVGFPGETDTDFNNTLNLLKKLKVSYLHVFSYSPRDNTEAIKYKQNNSTNVIKDRRKRLQQLSFYLFKKFIDENINTYANVLFEKFENGYLSGLTDNYIKVFVKGKIEYVKMIKKVKILNNEDIVLGEMCD